VADGITPVGLPGWRDGDEKTGSAKILFFLGA